MLAWNEIVTEHGSTLVIFLQLFLYSYRKSYLQVDWIFTNLVICMATFLASLGFGDTQIKV